MAGKTILGGKPREISLSPEDIHKANEWRRIEKKGLKDGKLPKDLPDWAYEAMGYTAARLLRNWRQLLPGDDPKLRKEAKKRLLKVWEALYLPLDYRQRVSLSDIWSEYDREKFLVKVVLGTLGPGKSLAKDRVKTAVQVTSLTSDEVEEIWWNRRRPYMHARDRLARRLNYSPDRLDKLLSLGRKFHEAPAPPFP